MKSTLLSLFAISLIACSSQNQIEINVIDADTRLPIEGARIYVDDPPFAARSDVHGKALLPETSGTAKITVHAKNHLPANLVLSGSATATAALQFDSTHVNPAEARLTFTRADTLRGSYGPYRANNDLLHYDLNVRLNIEKKYISGYNTITFKMLEKGDRVQIDLFDNMQVDSILFNGTKLAYNREFNAVFIDFPEKLAAAETASIDFHYSGHPLETGRFGGIAFKQDSLGNPWIYTACQGIGASLWWPNKDQQPDEVDSMNISVEVHTGLTDVSNGRFTGKKDLGDGFTRFDWKVNYPINNYSVSLNIGKYTHWADTLGEVTLDFWVLPYHLEQAQKQFAQAKPMLQCYEEWFGPYPFPKDGYKLIEVPYSGMEHQSAVTYGNLFQNGYLGRDWTGVGVSTKFDFIIIHESGHEWFGNSVTANDVSDAWIQEGWCTYAECVYVECMFGYEDALKYINGYKSKVRNARPIIGPTAVNSWPTGDQYFKGALFLHTLRHVIDDDVQWKAMLRDYPRHFKYKNIYTADVINYFNTYFDRNLTAIFEQYLYHAAIPVLEVRFENEQVNYRWRTDVDGFAMPVKVLTDTGTQSITPTSEWQSMAHDASWQVATELFYIEVDTLESAQ